MTLKQMCFMQDIRSQFCEKCVTYPTDEGSFHWTLPLHGCPKNVISCFQPLNFTPFRFFCPAIAQKCEFFKKNNTRFLVITFFVYSINPDGPLSGQQLSRHDFKLGLHFSHYIHIMGVIKPLIIHGQHVDLLCLLHAE